MNGIMADVARYRATRQQQCLLAEKRRQAVCDGMFIRQMFNRLASPSKAARYDSRYRWVHK